MADWIWWLIAAGVLTVAETSSLSFVLVMAGGGAAAGAVAAAFGAPVFLQFVVAAVVTVALLAGVRPIAQRHLTSGTGAVTGPESLIGRTAIVLARTDGFAGRVRVNGAEWSARVLEGSPAAEPGAHVRVVQISGATAVVMDESSFLGEQPTAQQPTIEQDHRVPDAQPHQPPSDHETGDPS